MKVFLLACLIVAASARSFLGIEKCTMGPIYWCENLEQAAECEAIEHCNRFVWNSRVGDGCSDCKKAVEYVHNFAKNNGSEMIKIMERLCSELKEIAAQCKAAVGLYGETIVSRIVQLTEDSTKLCQDLELCPATKGKLYKTLTKHFLKQVLALPGIHRRKATKGEYCEDCKLIFAELKDILQNEDTQNEIISLLKTVCAHIPSVTSLCDAFVEEYAPLIFDEIASLDDPITICNDLGLCNSTKKRLRAIPLGPAQLGEFLVPLGPGPVLINPEPASKPKLVKKTKQVKSPKTSLKCVICEFIMSKLDEILDRNATKREIELALDKVCSLLPSTVKNECQDVVNEYGPLIVELLLKQLAPSVVCTELKLCTGVKKSVAGKPGNAKAGSCTICKILAEQLLNAVRSNATEEEIKKALEDICNIMPDSIKTECNAIVDQYGDLIIAVLLGEITPDEICQALKLCPSGKKIFPRNLCSLGASYWCASYANAKKCKAVEFCKFTGASKKILPRNLCSLGASYWCASYANAKKCKSNILRELLLVCPRLPSALFLECLMVAHGSKDGNLCKPLEHYHKFESRGSENTMKDSKLCQECKYVLNYIGNLFPKNTSEETVINGLKIFCTRLPPDVVKPCDNIVDRYGDVIARFLLGDFDPEKLCEALEFCKGVRSD